MRIGRSVLLHPTFSAFAGGRRSFIRPLFLRKNFQRTYSSMDDLKLENFGIPIPEFDNQRIQGDIQYFLNNSRAREFPGMQPVSLNATNQSYLLSEDYFVCEKSDGIRILCYMSLESNPMTSQQMPCTFICDRNYQFRAFQGFFWPFKADATEIHAGTLLDGELVLDKNPHTGEQIVRFYIFDILLMNTQPVMHFPLPKRLELITNKVFNPFKAYYNSSCSLSPPFPVVVKEMFKAYHIRHLFAEVLPKLTHENDGLIFTPVQRPYNFYTNDYLLKWKPYQTVDFQLDLLNGKQAKLLIASKNGAEETGLCLKIEPNDLATLENGAIIECKYEKDDNSWSFLRCRTDKPRANDKRVLESIMRAIENDVTRESLIKMTDAIKSNWDIRNPK